NAKWRVTATKEKTNVYPATPTSSTRRGANVGTAMGTTRNRMETMPSKTRKTCSGRIQKDADHPDQKRRALASQAAAPNVATSSRRRAINRASRDPLERVLAATRHVPLDEDPVPDRELHQAPDRSTGVAAHLLLTHQRVHALGLEPAADHRVAREARA